MPTPLVLTACRLRFALARWKLVTRSVHPTFYFTQLLPGYYGSNSGAVVGDLLVSTTSRVLSAWLFFRLEFFIGRMSRLLECVTTSADRWSRVFDT